MNVRTTYNAACPSCQSCKANAELLAAAQAELDAWRRGAPLEERLITLKSIQTAQADLAAAEDAADAQIRALAVELAAAQAREAALREAASTAACDVEVLARGPFPLDAADLLLIVEVLRAALAHGPAPPPAETATCALCDQPGEWRQISPRGGVWLCTAGGVPLPDPPEETP